MKIDYEIKIHPEDMPVRGNVCAIDEDQDREAEDYVLAELERGNDWAWCMVEVRATVEINGQTFHGSDYLGGCSYDSEEDFKRGGYYEQMCDQAREDLLNYLKHEVTRGQIARAALDSLGGAP